MPVAGVYWTIIKTGDGGTFDIFATLNRNATDQGTRYSISCRNGVWGSWARIAIVELPQKSDIPFQPNWSADCDSYFFRDQFGVVTVIGTALKNSALSSNEIFAYLPAGFRPPIAVRTSGSLITSSGMPESGAIIQIAENGRLQLAGYIPSVDTRRVSFGFSFLAVTTQ